MWSKCLLDLTNAYVAIEDMLKWCTLSESSRKQLALAITVLDEESSKELQRHATSESGRETDHNSHSGRRGERVPASSLLQLTKTYLAIEAALKTSGLSTNTRRLLELGQMELDRDIAASMKLQINDHGRPRDDGEPEKAKGESAG